MSEQPIILKANASEEKDWLNSGKKVARKGVIKNSVDK